MPSPTSISDRYTERSATADSDRLVRALGTLTHTARTTGVDWLHVTCLAKIEEARSRVKLDSCGYLVRFDRTDPRRVF